MSLELEKINLSQKDKEVFESLSGQKIYYKNQTKENKGVVAGLLEQAKMNALVYLQRNKLGHKLSLFEENNLFASLVELQKKLSMPVLPRRVECYDISHISGKFVYGSMVVFLDGRPAKKFYRLFKTKQQNNDFENLKEVLLRRFKKAVDIFEQKSHEAYDQSAWKLPDLIVIDGGKGQLSSVVNQISTFNINTNFLSEVKFCSLAKNEERVFFLDDKLYGDFLLGGQTKFLIQRIRDEAHRFAITNNRKARIKTAKKSELDDIKGIGLITKNKLIKTFGSLANLVEQLWKDSSLVEETVGKSYTDKLKKHFNIIK